MLSGTNSFAQKSTAHYDSLLVNTWRFKSLEINENAVPLTEVQKRSKMIFNKNHTSKQVYDDIAEKGTWYINEPAATIEVTSDLLPDESVSYKILTLTSDTLVFEIKNEENNQSMKFSLYKEEN